MVPATPGGARWARRPRTLRPLVLCLSMIIVAVPSRATAQEEDEFRSEARMRLGPLYLTPSVTLTNFGVDTNVFNAAGERQQDFTFSLSPHVDTWLPFGRRTLLETSVTAGIDYYQKFESERSFNPNVRSRFSVFWNRLTLFGGGHYLSTRERPSFEIDVRSRRVVDGLLAGAELEVFRKLFIEVSGGYDRTNYDTDAVFLGTNLAETLNRDERSAVVAAKWRVTPLMTPILAWEARTYRFQLSPDRNADSVSATIGAELHSRALVSGSGRVGVKRFAGLGSRLPDYSGVVALASISYTWSGSTVFTYTAERDVEYSFEESEAYYVQTGHGLDVTRHLGRGFDVTTGVQRYVYAYRQLGEVGLSSSVDAGAERVDVIWNGRASIGFRVNRETRVGVGASYYDRQSGAGAARDYDGLRVGLTLSYGS